MTMIRLFEIPKNSKIYDGEEVLIFKHLDGMYSYCTCASGIVHILAITPLEEYLDGFRIITPHDTERSSVV